MTFDVRAGPRDAPAMQWLAAYAGIELAADGCSVSMPYADIKSKVVSDAIAIDLPEAFV